NAKASYAMGRNDGDLSTGTGPVQDAAAITPNFCHSDTMSCVSCHASWTNNCIGCHLVGEYNEGNNFSNITGERIVYREKFADFVYQSPVFFQLGIDTHGKISPISPNTEVFYSYEDRQNVLSEIFAFSDRNAKGANPADGFGALGHNAMMPHSIRGRVTTKFEGPRYCTSCHLTTEGLANYSTEYNAFRTAMQTDNFAALDFDLLKEHIGQNPNNQMNSPIWVHMVAGLGSGLFLFDENGCPVNPLDDDEDRKGCNDVAPADAFNVANVVLNLDRIVTESGAQTGSSNHLLLSATASPLRDGAGALDEFGGPLGATLIERLSNPTTGIILDSWIDADAILRGNAGTHVFP
ncbi:MAG: hypothetical protein KDC38_21450, partial [Planctomycetes bacterium]|nr:hypothetical protein [Planctomycetota bacterium]